MNPSKPALWLMAARPKTLPAAAAPVLAGVGLALHHRVFAAGPAFAALIGALLIQVATNLANDYFDFVKGGDTETRIGPIRVTQAGLMSPERVKRGMLVVLALAVLNGAYLVFVGGWPILVVGVASLICAVAYTGGPFPLAYNGLGDVFVFVFFGLVAVAGTYWVQALAVDPGALLAGAGLGAFTTAILVVNNLRDRETDEAAGKRTLAVRLGDRATVAEYVLCLLVAAVVPLVGVVRLGWPPAVLLAWVGVLASIPALLRVIAFEDRIALNPALGGTAKGVGLYGLGLGLGLWLGS